MTVGSLLIGFGPFSSTAMLWWGLAAGIPIVLHLWQRRQQRRIDWAAMRFLLAALAKHQRRIQLWQWLLLALRVAALLALAIALAEPLVRQATANPMRAPQLHLIAIDASASMQAEFGGQTAWSKAIRTAVERCRAGASGDGWTVWMLGPQITPVIGQPSYDVESVVQQLESLQPTDGAVDLSEVFTSLQDALGRATQQAPQLTERRVLLLTDLQVGTWQSITEPRVSRLLDGLQSQAAIELVDVSVGRSVPNAGFVDVRMESDLPLAGSAATVEARMKNWSDEQLTDRLVELLIDGQVRQSNTVDVPAGGETTVRFTEPLPVEAGQYEIEVRWPSDALPLDDRRWTVANARAALRVWCLGPSTTTTKYVATALQPEKDATGIEVLTGDLRDLQQLQPGSVDLLVLCDLPELTAVEVQRVERLAATGTGLLWFLGSRVQPEQYNREMGESPIFPLRLGMTPSAPARLLLDPLDYRHPLVQPFAQHPGAGLLSSPIFTVWPLVAKAAETEEALRAGEHALLVTRQSSEARVVVVLTDPTPNTLDSRVEPPVPWSALPAWPSFVPLMQTAMRYLVAPSMDRSDNEVGFPLSGTLTLGSIQASAELLLPSGERQGVPLTMRNGTDDAQWSFDEVDQAGVYRLQATSGEPLGLFVANSPSSESELRAIEPSLVPQGRARSSQQSVEEDSQRTPLPGYSLAPIALVGVLGLLLAESGLASWLGRRWR